MFKKIVYIILLITIASFLTEPAFALYWGIFDDYKQNIDNYAMFKLLNNKPIKYHLTTAQKPIKPSDNPVEDLKTQLDQEISYIDLIHSAFDIWTKDTKKIINQSGRTKEFKDIIPILDKSVHLVQTRNEKEADLIILFTSEEEKNKECQSSSSKGCFTKSTHKLVLVDPYVYPGNFEEEASHPLAILIHELGHYFGLTDQYYDLRNNDPIHSTTDRFKYESSVMAASFKTNLYCDDADAFINLIDLTLAMQNDGQFSARAKNGWASFCNGKKIPLRKDYYQDTFYKEAKILNKQNYTSKNCSYSYDKEGNISEMICPTPFNFYGKELSYRDSGIISSAKDEKFEYFYSYSNIEGEQVKIDYTLGYKAYFSDKTEINGKPSWTIDAGYNIYEFPSQGYLSIDSQKCYIRNYIPDTNFTAYNLTLTNGKLYGDYSYLFLAKSINSLPILVQVHPSAQKNTCTFKLCNFKSAKNIDEGSCVDIFKDDKTMQTVIKNTGVTYENFVKQTEEICQEPLPIKVINNAKDLCEYFNKVENYFDTLKSQGKKISFLPRLTKTMGK